MQINNTVIVYVYIYFSLPSFHRCDSVALDEDGLYCLMDGFLDVPVLAFGVAAPKCRGLKVTCFFSSEDSLQLLF